MARFRGPMKLNLVLLESHMSPLSFSFSQTARFPTWAMPGAAPLGPRFYAVILHMGTNGLNQDLEILNFVIFHVFIMEYDQIPH